MKTPLSIILIKTSSLGDVLHNLPVVTDICKNFPDAHIDWIVEENFAALPLLHPGVKHVIPVAIRRWRKSWWQARSEIQASRRTLRARHYDLALDTQGLLKSALITRCIPAPRSGYGRNSARESLASLFYDHTYAVGRNQHAVERNRQLAAQALGYTLVGAADFGITAPALALPWRPPGPYAVLLHATSRDDKLWDEQNWIALGRHLHQAGIGIVLPWGSEPERQRSERLRLAISGAIVPPRLDLQQAAALLGSAHAVIGVDTGLSHLAAALGVPTIGIYTATDPGLTGLYTGKNTLNMGTAGAPPAVGAVIAAVRTLTDHV
ncbi:MAG: lipopolysaccharide heptosyltransferase I [Pseudomonadota bacterium]